MNTGGHYVPQSDLQTVAGAGWSFAHYVVNPSALSSIDQYCKTAVSLNLTPVIGLYPYPYTLAGTTWTISKTGLQAIAALSKYPSSILFRFNEPYELGYTAKHLTILRKQIAALTPLKVWDDIGQPSLYAPAHGDTTSAVCDFAGVWRYPFMADGTYNRDWSASEMTREMVYCKAHGVTPVALLQSLTDPAAPGFRFPSLSEQSDWNATIRANAPVGTWFSWYVVSQVSTYTDWLANHFDRLPVTV
jgi:hypothetical protein